jgi:hypothetical protein
MTTGGAERAGWNTVEKRAVESMQREERGGNSGKEYSGKPATERMSHEDGCHHSHRGG